MLQELRSTWEGMETGEFQVWVPGGETVQQTKVTRSDPDHGIIIEERQDNMTKKERTEGRIASRP